MKNSLINKMILGALMALSMALTACNKKEAGSAVRVAGRGGSVVTAATCASGQTAVGRIYEPEPAYRPYFEPAVKIFLSTTMAQSQFGTIDPLGQGSNGVFLTPSLKFDSAGNIVVIDSSILIAVVDSRAILEKDTVKPYEVQFKTAYSGNLNRNTREFTVVFSDQFGWIRLSGKYNDSYASGEVSFQNWSSVDGSPINTTYRMGTFYVPTCGLLK